MRLNHDDVIRKFEAHREAASAPTSPDLFAPTEQHQYQCGQWVLVTKPDSDYYGCCGQITDVRKSIVRIAIPSKDGKNQIAFVRDADIVPNPVLDSKLGPAPFDAPTPDHSVDANKKVEPADAFDAALAKAIESAKATRDEWKADINEMLGLLTMASKEGDVNHVLTLTLIGKLREHISRA